MSQLPAALSKTPRLTRSLSFSCLGTLIVSGATALTAERARLGEADVVKLARAPHVAAFDATRRLSDAQSQEAALLPNPGLIWEREAVHTGPTAGQGSQDLLGVTVPVNAARPRAGAALAASEGAGLASSASLHRTAAVLASVLAFYDVVLAERRVEVLERAALALDEAARVVARREVLGSASGYERARLALARELGRSRLEETRGDLQSAKARLSSLLKVELSRLRVERTLSLLSADEATQIAAQAVETREAVAMARSSARLAETARSRAGWAWVPRLEVGAGLKRADAADMEDGLGYFARATLDLPIFDHGQALRARADARRALAEARSDALARAIEAEARSALATFQAAREVLARFESSTAGPVEDLLTAARSGYREGERSILELLDAERARAEVEGRRVELLGAAKRAEVRLRVNGGVLR